MKPASKRLAERYAAWSVRERGLTALALLGAIAVVGYSLGVAPYLGREQRAVAALAEQNAQLQAVSAQLAASQAAVTHPDAAAQAELEQLNVRLAEQGQRLSGIESMLVPPQNMPQVLEAMIGRKNGLRVLSLHTLPPIAVLGGKATVEGIPAKAPATAATPPSESAAPARPALYRHGVEITVEGSYAELVAYLQRLEGASPRLIWGSVALDAEHHPRLVLTLTVYTLSLDKAWLIV